MARAKCYHTMDAFVKLVVVLVRYSGDTSNTVTKVNLLNKVSITSSVTFFVSTLLSNHTCCIIEATMTFFK